MLAKKKKTALKKKTTSGLVVDEFIVWDYFEFFFYKYMFELDLLKKSTFKLGFFLKKVK